MHLEGLVGFAKRALMAHLHFSLNIKEENILFTLSFLYPFIFAFEALRLIGLKPTIRLIFSSCYCYIL
jgi:hypothetical protein